MPLRGTHSLEPSSRARGLRLAGSASKAASTQAATPSADIDSVDAVARRGLQRKGMVLFTACPERAGVPSSTPRHWPADPGCYPCTLLLAFTLRNRAVATQENLALAYIHRRHARDSCSSFSFSFIMQAFGERCRFGGRMRLRPIR
jgi:hypothetical protein